MRLDIAAGLVIGGAMAFWGGVTHDPMRVAFGWPLLIGAASIWRFERLERQIAELREGRTESR